MSLPDIPDLEAAHAALCVKGAYITKGMREIVRLVDTTYTHPTRGSQPVLADIRMLRRAGTLYAEEALRAPLAAHGATTATTNELVTLIEEYYGRGLVWGFAGFAMSGHPYAAEARAMRALLGSLKAMNLAPSLISDGGVSDGVLGLSGVFAERRGIPSLGFLPRQGLASAGWRTHMALRMQTYEGRGQLVGVTPDVLVCVAGGDGTQQECETALNQGSVVILMAMRAYDPPSFVESHRSIKVLADAEDEGRLFVCGGLQDIMSVASRAARAAGRISRVNRPSRLNTLRRLLAA